MTKREICNKHDTIAVCESCGGMEIRCIEYGIDDYVYCISGVLCDDETYHTYHKLKIYYDDTWCYIKLNGVKIFLHECIKCL